jgi:hypothetical protein
MKPLPKQPIIHFHHKIHGFLTVSGEFPVFFGGYAWHVSTPWTATTAALQGPSTRWTRWFSGSAVPPAELSLRPRVWRGWAWRVGRGLGIYWEWANEQYYPSNFCYIQKNGIIMYIYILFIIMSCLWLFFRLWSMLIDRLVIHDQLFGDEARLQKRSQQFFSKQCVKFGSVLGGSSHLVSGL